MDDDSGLRGWHRAAVGSPGTSSKRAVVRGRLAVGALASFVTVVLAACSSDEPPSPPPSGALLRAATRGDAGDVERLLARGADPDETDQDGRTAVTHAAYGGHAEVVRLLVDAGADVNRQDATRANALLSTGETGFVRVLG
jgi:hypothetical protein